ncbi:MAG: sensor histidine kinase, partial [Sulfurimonas sp.]|nr:sensor histidine kinase [Sulfurimonas sp.]
MFRNLRINVFLYYFLTTATFLAVLYYFIAIVQITNIPLLTVVLLCLIAFGGVVISKLSVDPLVQHVNNLQNLSKETLHELNLPISTIKTNMHMLRKNIENEKDLKRATRIERACDMLQQRYNELDYMIKLQSSNITKEDFNLDELITQRVAFLKPIYPHVEFNLNLHSTQINNDKVGLSKVIDNLIDNAVKYSQNIHNIDVRLQ